MTVEELRGKIIDMAQGVSFAEIANFIGLLDAYAAAARQEGAEKERERAYDYGLYLDNTSSTLTPAPKEKP